MKFVILVCLMLCAGAAGQDDLPKTDEDCPKALNEGFKAAMKDCYDPKEDKTEENKEKAAQCAHDHLKDIEEYKAMCTNCDVNVENPVAGQNIKCVRKEIVNACFKNHEKKTDAA